jgi:hypothetical protein
MVAHALKNDLDEITLFSKIHSQLIERYEVDPKLASEMAWDLLDMLSAVDGNLEIFEKYFLH